VYFENFLIMTILKFNKIYVIIRYTEATTPCISGGLMEVNIVTDCPLGHPGLLVKHVYFEGDQEHSINICEGCKETLDAKFGIPCLEPWSSQRDYLSICYDALAELQEIQNKVAGILPERRGRKPKDGRTIIFEDLGKLKKHIRVNRDALGEGKTVALLRLAVNLEEALNG